MVTMKGQALNPFHLSLLFGLFPDLDWENIFVRKRLPSKKAIENAKQRAEERKTIRTRKEIQELVNINHIDHHSM